MQATQSIGLVPLKLAYNRSTGNLEAWAKGWDITGLFTPKAFDPEKGALVIVSKDADEFASQVETLCGRRLEKMLSEEVIDQVEEILKTLPYPTGCICQDFLNGKVANDCHRHNENPMHFFGDFAFECTCPV